MYSQFIYIHDNSNKKEYYTNFIHNTTVYLFETPVKAFLSLLNKNVLEDFLHQI